MLLRADAMVRTMSAMSDRSRDEPASAAPYAPPYQAPFDARFAGVVAPRQRRVTPRLGRVSLVLAIGAFVVAAVPLWLAGRASGLAIGASAFPDGGAWTWSILSPARELVAIGEVGFWTGTALGTWALVQAIVAVGSRRGRVPAVWAIVAATASPILLAALTGAALALGISAD